MKKGNPRPHLNKGHSKIRIEIVVSGLFLLVFFLRFPSFFLPLSRDEGGYAYMASHLFNNFVPYLDSFDHKPPLTFLAYYVPSHFFGGSFLPIRLFSFFYTLAIAITGALLIKRMFSLKSSVLSVVFFAVFSSSIYFQGLEFNSETVMFLPLFLSLVTFWMWVEKRSYKLLFLTGILSGVSILIKQVAGVNLLLYLLYILFDTFKTESGIKALLKNLGIISAGVLSPFIPVLTYFAYENALGSLFFDTVSYNIHYVKNGLKPTDLPLRFQSLPPPILYLRWLVNLPYLLLVMSIVAFAGGIAMVVKKIKTSFITFFILWIVALFIGAKAGGGRDAPHYYLPFVYGLSFLFGVTTTTLLSDKKHTLKILAIAPVIIAFVFLFDILRLQYNGAREIMRLEYSTEGDGFVDAVKVGKYIRERTSPNDKLAVFGSEQEVYFYSERRAASQFPFTYPLGFIPNGRTIWINEIMAADPEFIVRPLASEGPQDFEYFETFVKDRKYKELIKIGYFIIYGKDN